MDVYGPGIADLVRAPHAVEQLAPGVGTARMCREGRQELVLLWPEVHRGPVEPQLVRYEIELVAVGDRHLRDWPRASLRIEDGRTFRQLGDVDRLR